jgi:aldehyde:ferredoxin oxidoreductase
VPDRLFEQGGTAALDRDAFQELVNAYYEMRGWTPSGIPLDSKKVELGLDAEPSYRL